MAENQELNIVVKLVDQASTGLKNMSNSLDNFWNKVDEQTKGAQNFTKAVIATAAAVWGVAVKKFMDFEKTMSGVKAVLSPTAEEFDNLNEKAKQLWKDTIYSQSEVAQAMEMLAKNGLNASQILDGAADATVNLAAAAGTDLSTAADIATDSMAIFWIQAENMSKAINGISGVAVASKFTVDDYALALAQGWWVAKAVWVSFDDFNASIAWISNLFASGSDAGTSFKVFLQRLVPASNNAAAAMEDLWIITKDWQNQFFDATGKLKSMGEISGILQKSLKGLSDEQKNQALSTIFGTDAMRAAVWLAEQGADGFAKLNAQIQGTDAAEQAKVRLDNLSGSLEKLMGSIDVMLVNLWASIGEVLRPAIDWVTNALDDLNGTFNNLSPAMQTTISVVGGVWLALAGLVLAVWSVWIVLPAITAALSTVAAALWFLLSPIWLVIAAVAALAIAWSTNFMWIQDTTKAAFTAIQPYFDLFIKGLSDIWKSAEEATDEIVSAFKVAFDFLKPYIKAFINIVGKFWKDHFSDVILVIQGAFTIIKALFQGAFEIIKWLFQVFSGLLSWDWKKLWEGIQTITGGFFTIIKWLVMWGLDILKWQFWIFTWAVKVIWSGFWEALQAVWSAVLNSLRAVNDLFWNWLKNLFSAGGNAIAGAWRETMNSISSIATTVWDGVKNTIQASMNWIINKINGVIGKVNNISGQIGVPAIPTIPQFQNWGIVQAFQNGGLVAGSPLTANHDQVPAMLDPGELILNRAQQKNLADQITNQNQTVNINFGGVTITNGMELDTFLGKVKQVIYEETKKANLWLIL